MGSEYDNELVERIGQGDHSAFQELYDTYRERVYRTSLRILGNYHDAEDGMHDAFVKIYENLKNFRKESRLSTWIYRITVNIALAKRKQVKKLLFLSAPEELSSRAVATPDVPETESEFKRILLQEALNRLRPKLKTCFVLRVIEGLSYEEIAEILKIPVGTVRSRLNSGWEKIEKFLKKK